MSDVWSVGATLYFMLTGRPPREFSRGKDQVEVILHHDVIPIRQRDIGIPLRVAEVIDRSIADNVKDRYQTAIEFREALTAVL